MDLGPTKLTDAIAQLRAQREQKGQPIHFGQELPFGMTMDDL